MDLSVELNPFGAKLLDGAFNVIAVEREALELSDPLLVTLGSEKHEPRLRSGDAKLDPALSSHRLVGRDAETHLRGPELKRPVLVRRRDPRELQFLYHGPTFGKRRDAYLQAETTIAFCAIVRGMVRLRTTVDSYVFETLMADLAGHDRSPSSFLVYLILWHRSRGSERTRVPASLQTIAEDTGLSKRGVQDALRLLQRRGLVSRARLHATAVPEYRVHRPWIRRNTRRAPSRRGPA